jgi:hypothetical protein
MNERMDLDTFFVSFLLFSFLFVIDIQIYLYVYLYIYIYIYIHFSSRVVRDMSVP